MKTRMTMQLLAATMLMAAPVAAQDTATHRDERPRKEKKESDGGVEIVGVIDGLFTMGKMIKQARDIDTELRGHPYDPRIDGEYVAPYGDPAEVDPRPLDAAAGGEGPGTRAMRGELKSAPFRQYVRGASKEDDKLVRNCMAIARGERYDLYFYPELIAKVAGRWTVSGRVEGDSRYDSFSCAKRQFGYDFSLNED